MRCFRDLYSGTVRIHKLLLAAVVRVDVCDGRAGILSESDIGGRAPLERYIAASARLAVWCAAFALTCAALAVVCAASTVLDHLYSSVEAWPGADGDSYN